MVEPGTLLEPKPRTTVRCIICYEPISANAKKCTKCDSYQDWTHHVFRWSGVVTAVVALVPLWSMAWSLWQIAVPHNADIHVSALTCDSKEIAVAAANIGQKIGVIKSVDFAVVRNPPADIYRDSRTLTTDQSTLIKPNDLITLKYRPSPNGPEELPVRQSSSTCKYQLTFTALGLGVATPDQTTATCDCPK